MILLPFYKIQKYYTIFVFDYKRFKVWHVLFFLLFSVGLVLLYIFEQLYFLNWLYWFIISSIAEFRRVEGI